MRTERESISDRYRGVTYEVVRWKHRFSEEQEEEYRNNPYLRDTLKWKYNYYIYLPFDHFPTDGWKRVIDLPVKKEGKWETFDYMRVSLFDYMEFHHGITFYEKRFNGDGSVRGVKVGCDYNHLWDEGFFYDLEHVERDAKHSIDCLCESVPGLLTWCQNCGAWTDDAADEKKGCKMCRKKNEGDED